MADNTTLNTGTGGDVIATDDIGPGVKYQRVKVNFGSDGSATDVSSASPLPVDTELTTVDADTGAGTDTRAGVVLVRAESGGGSLVGSANPLPVNQTAALPAGNNNIGDVDVVTVPAPLSTTGGGTEAAALRVTIANNSTDLLPVSDNGGSLTVDGTVTANLGTANVTNVGTFAVQDSEKVADNAAFTDGTTKVQPAGYIFDEVAGTALTENDTAAARIDSKRAQVGVIEDATTRGQRATVTASNALKVDGSAVTQPVSGTVTANAGSGPFPVSDNAGSLTVDAPVATPVFVRLSDGAAALVGQKTMANSLPVAIASDQSALSLTTGTASIGDVGIRPRTSNGFSTFHLVSAGTTNATNIKASAGQVFGWYISNRNTSNFMKVVFHNTAGTPTAGASVFATVDIPPLSAANVFNDIGIAFGTGIAITTVSGAADTDATAVAANDLNINIYYA